MQHVDIKGRKRDREKIMQYVHLQCTCCTLHTCVHVGERERERRKRNRISITLYHSFTA